MATDKEQGRKRRSTPGWALFSAAQLIKLGAAGLAFWEFAGDLRPEGLAFAAFLLTVAQSLESTSGSI